MVGLRRRKRSSGLDAEPEPALEPDFEPIPKPAFEPAEEKVNQQLKEENLWCIDFNPFLWSFILFISG